MIETLDENVFVFQPSHELTVELWENPIVCNCSMTWLKKWIDAVSLCLLLFSSFYHEKAALTLPFPQYELT